MYHYNIYNGDMMVSDLSITKMSILNLLCLFHVLTVVYTAPDSDLDCQNLTITHSCNISDLPTETTQSYIEEIGLCLYHLDKLDTYDRAEEMCRNYGLKVMTIKSEKVDKHYTKYMKKEHITRSWIGAKQKKFQDWTYVESNITADLTRQENRKSDHCAILNWHRTTRTGSIDLARDLNPYPCKTNRSFLCRKSDENCVGFNKRCLFKFEQNQKSWFEARHFCKSDKGDLFFLKKGESLPDLSSYLFTEWPKSSGSIYVGLRHQDWFWNDSSEVVYSNWNYAHGFDNDCVQVRNEKWHSVNCTETAFVVCMKDLNEAKNRCSPQSQTDECSQYLIALIILAVPTVFLSLVAAYLVKFKPPLD